MEFGLFITTLFIGLVVGGLVGFFFGIIASIDDQD